MFQGTLFFDRLQSREYRLQMKMTVRVGTLRAASALFPMVGCCPQRHIVLCLLFCVLRTQHAASLHAHISIWQYSHIPTYPHVVIITKVGDANLNPKLVIRLFCVNERFGLNNSNYYCIFVVGKGYC
jgi:hypothetical protein